MICHNISIYRSIDGLLYPNGPLKNIQAMKATLFLMFLYIGQTRAAESLVRSKFTFSNGEQQICPNEVSLIRPFKAY